MNKKEDSKSEGTLQQWNKEGEGVNGKMHQGGNRLIGVNGVGGTIHGSESEHNKSNINDFPGFKSVIRESNNGFSDFFLETKEKNHYDKGLNQEKRATCISENNYDYNGNNNHENNGNNNNENNENNNSNNPSKQVNNDDHCKFMHLNGNIKETAVECDNVLQTPTIITGIVNDGIENTEENVSSITENNFSKLGKQQNGEFINGYENVDVATQQKNGLTGNAPIEENDMNNGHVMQEKNVFEKIESVLMNQTVEADVLYSKLNNQTNEGNTLCVGVEQNETVVADPNMISLALDRNDNRYDNEVRLNEMKTHSDVNILPNTLKENIHISDAKDMVFADTDKHVEAEMKPEGVCEKKENSNETNGNSHMEGAQQTNVTENKIVSMSNMPNSTNVTGGEEWLQQETYESTVNNIIEFHKNMKELNLGRGEIFLNEHEYMVTSYMLLNNGFRFFPCETTIVPKKRKDLSKRDSQWVEKKIQRSGSMDIYKTLDASLIKNEGDLNFQKKRSMETNVEKGLDEVRFVNEEVNVTQEGGHAISEESRERKEMVNEILNSISSLCGQLLSVEGNFKNLKNNVEDNAFTFNCIVEKMKNDKYGNIVYLYNDIYLYFNNLLFLSKPSSRNWMKLHELSVQITNTMFNVQQRREHMWKEKRKILRENDNHNLSGQTKITEESHAMEKKENDNKIKEEEKSAFQELLARVHPDLHYELYMRFKNKAVWKTLEGGEIELNDRQTDVCIFREMYKWCKKKSEGDGKNKSEAESSSSEVSY